MEKESTNEKRYFFANDNKENTLESREVRKERLQLARVVVRSNLVYYTRA